MVASIEPMIESRRESGPSIAAKAPLLRRVLGAALREQRLIQHRTLREVSAEARVSLGYLSEVERGQKEASSELLASICSALGVRLADVLHDVSEELASIESLPASSQDLQTTARAA